MTEFCAFVVFYMCPRIEIGHGVQHRFWNLLLPLRLPNPWIVDTAASWDFSSALAEGDGSHVGMMHVCNEFGTFQTLLTSTPLLPLSGKLRCRYHFVPIARAHHRRLTLLSSLMCSLLVPLVDTFSESSIHFPAFLFKIVITCLLLRLLLHLEGNSAPISALPLPLGHVLRSLS